MIVDRDYVYVFGPEWADELLNFIERDPLAQSTMAQYGLTRDDVRSYYLAQPHFERIYHQLIDNGDDFVHDPVDSLLHAVKTTKDVSLHGHNPHQFRPVANTIKSGQMKVGKMPRAGGIRNPVALFVRLLMS